MISFLNKMLRSGDIHSVQTPTDDNTMPQNFPVFLSCLRFIWSSQLYEISKKNTIGLVLKMQKLMLGWFRNLAKEDQGASNQELPGPWQHHASPFVLLAILDVCSQFFKVSHQPEN